MNKSNKFTPGPWSVVGNTIHNGKGVIAVTARNDSTFQYIAGHGTLEDTANARLIAACPEMLEALREICSAFVVASGRTDYYPYQQALKVISKATGGTNE